MLGCRSLPTPDFWVATEGGGVDFKEHLFLYSYFSGIDYIVLTMSLAVQGLRLLAPDAGGTGSVPGSGRSCMPHGKAKKKKREICILFPF